MNAERSAINWRFRVSISLAIESASKVGVKPDTLGLAVRVVEISPELATEWLELNFGNRKPSPGQVDKYARDMRPGNWSLTGETIIFDSEGFLRNGQNRLLACIKADTSFQALVVWGVDPASFKNMDRGFTRSVSVVVGLTGIADHKDLVPAAQYIGREEKGHTLGSGGGQTLTVDEIIDTLTRHPELKNSLEWASGAKKIGVNASMAVYLHYRLARIDPWAASTFFSSVHSLANLEEGNPILVLGRQLLSSSMGARSEYSKPITQAAYVIKAWNAWASGATLGLLRVPRKADKFPTPVDFTSRRWTAGSHALPT
jgi:hypothetical protein